MVQISSTKYRPTQVDAATHRKITDRVRSHGNKYKHLRWFLAYHNNRLPEWDMKERDQRTGQRVHTSDANSDYVNAHHDWESLVSQATGRNTVQEGFVRERHWRRFVQRAEYRGGKELREWLECADPEYSIEPLDYRPQNNQDWTGQRILEAAHQQAEKVWSYIEGQYNLVQEEIAQSQQLPTPPQRQAWMRIQQQNKVNGGGPGKTPIKQPATMNPPKPGDHNSFGMTEGEVYFDKQCLNRMVYEEGLSVKTAWDVLKVSKNAACAVIEEALNRSLSRVWNHVNNGNAMALISAARARPEGADPAAWAQRNADAHEALQDHADANGWGHQTITGFGQERHPETGELVPSKEQTLAIPAHPDDAGELEHFARQMGNHFDQHSVIMQRPGETGASLIHTAGSDTPGNEYDLGPWHANRTPEFHSMLKGGRTFAFGEDARMQRRELRAVRRSARPDRAGNQLLEPHEAGTTDNFAGGLEQG